MAPAVPIETRSHLGQPLLRPVLNNLARTVPKNFFSFSSKKLLTPKRFSGNLFPAARTSRKLTMTKEIEYCNGCNDNGIQFYYGGIDGQRMQVYIACTIQLEYEFKAYTHREDRAIFGDGQIIIDWKNSYILGVDGLSVDLIDSDGHSIFNLCDHNIGNGREQRGSIKIRELLNLPIDNAGTKLKEAVWEAIECEGPDQDSDSCWVEAIAHNEEEAKEEAMAAAYPEEI